MILCLTGYSCIGKTSIAQYLVNEYSYSLISVREISHKLARKNGFSRTREWLAKISIEQYLLKCRNYIMSIINCNNCSQNYIIDDLFDIKLWESISTSYISLLINLELHENIRNERMLKREFFDNINEAYQELIFLDSWKVKFGISNVILSANCTIDATNKSVSEIAETIMSIINKEDGYFCE